MSHKFSIEITPKKQLTEEEYTEIITLCSQAFGEDYTLSQAGFEDSVHVLARLEGVLVSHAEWITRWLQVGSGPLMRAAYVEGVTRLYVDLG